MPRRASLVVLAVAAGLFSSGCPERKYPERGIELDFAQLDGGREVFERRLAQLQVKARILEDTQRLAVRLPEGVDPDEVKRLLGRPARLELCEELTDDAKAWCAAKGTAEVKVTAEPEAERGCFFSGADAGQVKQAAAEVKISGRLLLEQSRGLVRTWAVPQQSCFSPRFIEGRWKRDPQMGLLIMLTLDTAAARDFEKLTARLVNRRLLIVLDGEVESAPTVMEPIPGGRIQLSVPNLSDGEARVLTAALVGGPLEGVELLSVKPFGPPRL